MKKYFIIGGSSGIGKAAVEILEKQNCEVYATYNTNMTESRQQVSFHHLNMLEDELDFDYLPDALDGVLYCPGSINLKPFNRIKDEDYMADYKLQVVGAVRVLRALLPRLKQNTTSSFVLFSTVAVQKGFTFHAQVAASKGAIEGLTRALAAELAPSIRVNAVAPSLTNTSLAAKFLSSEEKQAAQADKNPLKRIGQPEDAAQAAVFLLSDKSSWITGQILHVDGGFSSLNS